MPACGRGFASGLKTIRGAGSATPTTTHVDRAGSSTTRRFSGSGARKACGCLLGADASDWAPAPPRRCRPHTRRTASGLSTSNSTPRPTADSQDRIRSRRAHPRMPRWPRRAQHHRRDLIAELDRIAAARGYPAVLRADNGPELACAAMADWAAQRVGLHFIPPGQPWRNGYVESVQQPGPRRMPEPERLWSLTQARVVITDWKQDYNHRRRHSSLGYLPPAVYAAGCTHR